LVPDNSIFFETDTAVQFQFTGSTWDVFGGGSVTIPSSENSTPFTNTSRPDLTDETVLLDMEDFSDLDIFIEELSYVSPTAIKGGPASVDGILTNAGDTEGISSGTSPEELCKIDFGSVATRVPTAIIKKNTNLDSTYTLILEVSNSESTGYSTVDSDTFQFLEEKKLQGTSQAFRYIRITMTFFSGNTATNNFFPREVYDSNLLGGTVAVSVELQNDETALWQEIVSAGDIGTSTTDVVVHGHIGKNAVDVAGSEKNYNLPKTTTGLRLRLVVNGGGSITSCSIIKSGFQG
jgi:hypothetical protein